MFIRSSLRRDPCDRQSLNRARQVVLTASVAAVAALMPSGVLAQSITSIGVSPGGDWSFASAVSGNGSAVSANVDFATAHRWTTSGLSDIGLLSGASGMSADDINEDGTVIVGGAFFVTPEETARAHRWTSAGGFQDLGVLPGGFASVASGVSGDGNIVTGFSIDADFNIIAFRWTSADGMQSLGTLPGGTSSDGRKVSRDGSTIVGVAGTPQGDRAFAWTQSGGMQNLGLLSPSDSTSSAFGVNGDGTVIAGVSGNTATIWTNGVAQSLGMLPGADISIAHTLSDDGSLAGGYSFFGQEPVATLWSQAMGTVDLNTYLPSLGIDLTGWDLQYTRDISTDGMTIVGDGMFNGEFRGWVVTIPAPGAAGLLGLGGLLAARRRR